MEHSRDLVKRVYNINSKLRDKGFSDKKKYVLVAVT